MSAGERFLVTGAFGCIGAWTLHALLAEGAAAVALDLGGSRHRLELVLSPDELAQVTVVRADVTDLAQLERALEEHAITHVVHLAALQIPFVRADPPLGARVNVVGTTNVFEACKRHGVHGLAYASSVAVYAPDASLAPRTLYGVFKRATEEAARCYWVDERVPTVGLRPAVVYGLGRDQGLTSAPTLALAAAARGEPYRIPFGGRMQLHYAPDVAAAFVAAAREATTGAAVHDLGGASVHMDDLVAAVDAAVPDAAGTITFDGEPLPFPDELDGGFAPFRQTPLGVAVRDTIDRFRAA
jgi:nucleoside-diphosphate-sugar epimerase